MGDAGIGTASGEALGWWSGAQLEALALREQRPRKMKGSGRVWLRRRKEEDVRFGKGSQERRWSLARSVVIQTKMSWHIIGTGLPNKHASPYRRAAVGFVCVSGYFVFPVQAICVE